MEVEDYDWRGYERKMEGREKRKLVMVMVKDECGKRKRGELQWLDGQKRRIGGRGWGKKGSGRLASG